MIMSGIGKKAFGGGRINESIRKKAMNGEIDKNSVFYDLVMTPLTPRTIGLRLHFFKGAKDISSGVGLDIEKF